MLKNILFGVSTLFLISCTDVNSSGEKTITKDGDTVADVDISVSKLDALTNLVEEEAKKDEKVIFKAQGTEPGWIAEFSAYKLRLIVDYGKDSLIVDDSFEKVNDDSGFTYIKTSADNKSLTVSIQNKPCIESGSGDKAERTVIIKYNMVIYKGCGNSIR
jgi:uncharacterized membrane protein